MKSTAQTITDASVARGMKKKHGVSRLRARITKIPEEIIQDKTIVIYKHFIEHNSESKLKI